MEAFLRALLPRVLAADVSFQIYPYQGKGDLLGKLQARLRGYKSWLPATTRIVVLVDRDDDECIPLKAQLEAACASAQVRSRTASVADWQVVTRIAIEELEAWYFGDWEAVRHAYPDVSANIPYKARFRKPDGVKGGTWEAIAKIMKSAGYFTTGLRKTELARRIGIATEPSRNTSPSFRAFHAAILEAVA